MINHSTEQDSEIDLKNFFNLIIRNKFLIIKFSFVFAILFFIYSLTKKNIWEGKTQIVLKSTSANQQQTSWKEKLSLQRDLNIPIPGISTLKSSVGMDLSTFYLITMIQF